MADTAPKTTSPSSKKAATSPIQACPLAELSVNVVPDKGMKLEGSIAVSIEGPSGGSAGIEAGEVALFENLEPGGYTPTVSLSGWAQKAPPKSVPVGAGKCVSTSVTLVKAQVEEVTPKPGSQALTWYINHPADPNKCLGRKIKVQAKLDMPLEGVPIYFTIDADEGNNSKLDSGLSASLSAESSTTDAQGIANVELCLAQYGGDKYRVSASTVKDTEPGKGDAKESAWFEVWNKVFVEIDNMKRPGGGTYANSGPIEELKKEYAKHWVQLDNTGADSEPDHARVSHELELGPYCAGLQSGTDTPHTHLVLLDTIIWDPEDQAQEFQVNKLTGTKRFAASLTTVDVTQWRKSGSDVMVKITKAGSPGAWQTMPSPDSHLGMTWEADDFVLNFDLQGVLGLPSGSADLPADVSKLELKLVLKRYIEGSGAKQGSSSIVGMRGRERDYSGSDLKNSTLKTMIHETGHAMGMASKYASDGTEPATYYESYGSHCNNDSNGCVMYGFAHLKPAYCDVCSDALRARKLDTLPIGGSSAL